VLELLILGVVVGSNNFAAALTLGALGQVRRRLRIAAVFGAIEFVVPLIGLWIGAAAADLIGSQARWIAAALLIGVGILAIVSGLRHRRDDERFVRLATSWGGLVLLAAGLSLDNLVVGFSLGLTRSAPLLVAGTIAAFSFAFTWIGITAGSHSRRHWERWAEVGSGLLLAALGTASIFLER
jgi:manganese efflux pump family protein